MGYIVALFFVFLGLYKKDSRCVTAVMLAYICILIGFNEGSADYWVYETMYNNCFDPIFATHEPGYMLLCKLFHSLGFSFVFFRTFLGMLMAFLYYKAIRYFTKNVNFALALLLIFPLCAAPSGLRNSLSGAIVLYAVHFLFKKEKRSLLKYFLTILLATLFHYNSVFFFILPLATIRKFKFPALLIATLSVIPALVFVAKTNLPYLLLSQITSSEKFLHWFDFSFFFGKIYLFALALALVMIFLLYYSKRFLPKHPVSGCTSREDVITVAKIGVLTLLAFSGAIFKSVVFLRYLIALMPLYYVFFSETLCSRNGDTPETAKVKRVLRVFLPLYCGFLLWFVYGFWIGGHAIQNFQKNLLFSWLS